MADHFQQARDDVFEVPDAWMKCFQDSYTLSNGVQCTQDIADCIVQKVMELLVFHKDCKESLASQEACPASFYMLGYRITISHHPQICIHGQKTALSLGIITFEIPLYK